MTGPLGFLAGRYLHRRRRLRGVGAPLLSFLGLAVGVLTLNGVLAVMNGFQLTFIESLVELSSSHLRWTPADGQPHPETVAQWATVPGLRAVVPTTESQTLVASSWGERRGASLRGFDPDALQKDPGLAAHLGLPVGASLPGPGQVIVGQELARALGVGPGDKLRLTALTGTSFSLLRPEEAEVVVTALFETGYYEIDAGWIVGNLADTLGRFAGPGDFFYALKLTDGDRDLAAKAALEAAGVAGAELTTWRDYNAAFFGALRTEKAVMMVLVGLIFFVVGVNIYFAQKRAVGEHREDIALWAAVGVPAGRLRLVFTLEGLFLGLGAAAVGTVAGLGVAGGVRWLNLLSTDAFYVPVLPARVLPHEVAWVALACVAAATAAAWLASAAVTRIPPAEVLKTA